MVLPGQKGLRVDTKFSLGQLQNIRKKDEFYYYFKVTLTRFLVFPTHMLVLCNHGPRQIEHDKSASKSLKIQNEIVCRP